MLKFSNNTKDTNVNFILRYPKEIPIGFQLSLVLMKPKRALEMIAKKIVRQKFDKVIGKIELTSFALAERDEYEIPVINIVEGKYSGLGILYYYFKDLNNVELPVFLLTNLKTELKEI